MWHDLLTVFFLVFLEGALSLDNAVVLAVLVQPLPENLRQKALTYGIHWSFCFQNSGARVPNLPNTNLVGETHRSVLSSVPCV
jgi:hypothetical protein